MPGWRLVSEALLLAAWLGAAALFAAVVTPALFAALPSRALAGLVVGRVLPVLFGAGVVVGLWVAFSAWLGAHGLAGAALGRMIAALTLTAACAVSQFVVGGRIARLREALGPSLDALASDDPRRLAFGRLHVASVAGLGAAVLAALLALWFAASAIRARS